MKSLALALVLGAGAGSVQGAISVGTGGSGTLTFDTLPAATEWSCLSIAGGGGTATDLASMDAAVSGVTAASFGTLPSISVDPTGSEAVGGAWNSVALRLTSRATGNTAAAMMATLQNNSGAAINDLNIHFTLSGSGTDSELPGYVLYYSLTGATGSWQRVGIYSTLGAVAADNIALTSAWENGATLYVMWVDDNANGVGDYWYGIDDVSFAKSAPAANIVAFGPGAVIAGTNIAWSVPYGSNPASLAPTFTLSAGAHCYQTDPRLGGAVEIFSGDSFSFTSPRHYWVQSSDTLVTNDYLVTVTVLPNFITDGLVLWLDASQLAGLSDGQQVNTWTDMSGQNNHALRDGGSSAGYPKYVSTGINSLPVVRFNSGGGTGDYLRFNRISTIRTVFWVIKENATVSDGHFLLGDDDSYDFHRGEEASHTIWDGQNGWSSGNIRSGTTKLMGTAVNGTAVGLPPDQFQLISLVTSGTVQANTVTQDRVGTHGSWQGDIAEILIYNRALTNDEELTVGSYLTQKYQLETAYAPLVLTVKLNSPANNQAFPAGTDVTASAKVQSGTTPYAVKFYQKTGAGGFVQVGGTQTGDGPTFTQDLGTLANNTYQVYAEVTDSAGTPATATSSTNTFTVADAVTTATTLETSGSPSTYGQSVTFTATVAPTPTGGTVQFFDNGVALVSPVAVNTADGKATCTTSLLAFGSHPITAVYSGHGIYLGSSAGALSQAVGKAVLTVTADNKVRAPGTSNPTFTYKITGYQNGENATSAGLTGTPTLGSEAGVGSPVGDYPITCEVGTLDAGNYSFAAVAGTLRIMEGAVPVSNGLVCWYDASVGVTVDGSGVLSWDDQSGNGHQATRGGHGAPSLVAGDVNGKSAVHLRGSNNILDCAGGMFTKEQYVVVRSPNATWNGSGSFLGRASNDFLTVRASSYNVASGTTGFWQDHFPTAVSKNGTVVPLNQNQDNLGNFANGCGFALIAPITEYMVLKITVDNSADAANLAAYPYYQIGQNETLGSCDMDIAEIIGYDSALSSEDEFAVTSYLGAKYGIVLAPSYRWKGPNGGVWSNAENWNNTMPASGTVAVFSDNGSAGANVSLDIATIIKGITFNTVAPDTTITASDPANTITFGSGATINADGGSHAINADFSASSGLTKTGVGTVSLGGVATGVGNLRVEGGELVIANSVSLAADKPTTVTSGGKMTITGAYVTGGADQIIGDSGTTGEVVLSGSGTWTHTGGGVFVVGNDRPTVLGVLTINDNAVLDLTGSTSWSRSLNISVGWAGGTSGRVIQNGGKVITFAESAGWCTGAGFGSGVALGNWTDDPCDATYDLNGGELITSSVWNLGYDWGLCVPDIAQHGSTAIFNFNGGVIKPNMGDSTLPDAISEGMNHFMGNLTHAYVLGNGAKFDTEFNNSLAQELEHGPSGPAIDGGLTKSGTGTLTLLKASTYTGPTKVKAGVLSCATADSLAATALEIDALAKVDLAYTGTRIIPSLKLGGVAKGPGEYGYATDPTFFTATSTGTVTVAALSPYQTWANANAGGGTPGEDYNHDGVQNGIAYFMGMNGLATNPSVINGKVTWPHVNTVSSFEVQVSDNLSTWAAANPADVDTVSSPGNVIYTLPSGAAKKFCRLMVIP